MKRSPTRVTNTPRCGSGQQAQHADRCDPQPMGASVQRSSSFESFGNALAFVHGASGASLVQGQKLQVQLFGFGPNRTFVNLGLEKMQELDSAEAQLSRLVALGAAAAGLDAFEVSA